MGRRLQVAASDTDLRFVGRCFGAAEDSAATIFSEALRMMRSGAARAIQTLIFPRANFSAAIWADWIHLRCRS